MSWRIWLRCDRNYVDRIRYTLKINDKLEKTLKIKPGATERKLNLSLSIRVLMFYTDERIIPTILQFDHKPLDKTGEKEILNDLGLVDANLEDLAEIKWLPASNRKINSTTDKPVSIEDVVVKWLEALPETIFANGGTRRAALVASSPKRWTVYEPMVLLPSGSFQDVNWTSLLKGLDQNMQDRLWESILNAISVKMGGKRLSHLAINAGIPLTQDLPSVAESENIMRSPSHLVILYGDFGQFHEPGMAGALPTEKDFDEAFWVSTKQNGIYQTWAPRYTMFSRGNIKEKARILSFRDTESALSKACGQGGAPALSDTVAVDLYAGIGYFAFSYVAMGIGSVLCWEINPWSVEGLRRGAEMNGWSVKIVRGKELDTSVWVLLHDRPRLLVFEESNESTVDRIQRLREYELSGKERFLGDIIHVNCGFLPSSEPSWLGAWKIVSKRRSAWLHLHENVGWNELEDRKRQIADIFERLSRSSTDVHLHHVELVKTFAPDVWHCVFDVHIVPAPADAP
jgi:tRNA wybutosine-synthesizing protein 2